MKIYDPQMDEMREVNGEDLLLLETLATGFWKLAKAGTRDSQNRIIFCVKGRLQLIKNGEPIVSTTMFAHELDQL